MNFAFLPMHLTGLFGMPRRIYTYPAGMGWSTLNTITSIGAFVFAFGLLLLVINIIQSLRRGRLAGANPWDAATLEWSVPGLLIHWWWWLTGISGLVAVGALLVWLRPELKLAQVASVGDD